MPGATTRPSASSSRRAGSVDPARRPRSARPGCRRRPGGRGSRCRRRPGRCGSRSRAWAFPPWGDACAAPVAGRRPIPDLEGADPELTERQFMAPAGARVARSGGPTAPGRDGPGLVDGSFPGIHHSWFQNHLLPVIVLVLGAGLLVRFAHWVGARRRRWIDAPDPPPDRSRARWPPRGSSGPGPSARRSSGSVVALVYFVAGHPRPRPAGSPPDHPGGAGHRDRHRARVRRPADGGGPAVRLLPLRPSTSSPSAT